MKEEPIESLGPLGTAATVKDEPTAATGPQSQIPVADYQAFISYLKQFVPILLDADHNSAREFDRTLNEKAQVDIIKKFMFEPLVRFLMIRKYLLKGISLKVA